MKEKLPYVVITAVVNRKPKLLHGIHIIKHPNGETEQVKLCPCCPG